jgi:superfamily II DNA or RNA helicase
MLRLSYSQLNCFLSCKRQYYHKYVLKLKEKDEETKWADFGKAMHEVLEEFYNKSNINWQDNILIKWKKYKLEERMKFDVFKVCVINGLSLNFTPDKIEEKMFLRIGEDQFVGYLDIVDTVNDIILDWKSSTFTKDKIKDYKEQLICYSYLYYRKNNRYPKQARIFFNKVNKEIIFNISDNPGELIITKEEILGFEDFVINTSKEIKKLINTLKNGNHWPQNLEACHPFCGYKYVCHEDTEHFKYKIVIKNGYGFLEGNITPLLLTGIDLETKFDLPNKYFIQKSIIEKCEREGRKIPANIKDIGTVRLFNKIHRMFPLGFLNKVKRILKDYSEYNKKILSLEIEDLRAPDIKIETPNKLITNKELRPYQIEAIESFLYNNCLGFLEIATGGGKTLVTAELIRCLKVKTLWIIDKKELLHQTKEEFENVLGFEMGIIGDGEFELKDVTLATIQSLYSRLNYESYLLTFKKNIIKEEFKQYIEDKIDKNNPKYKVLYDHAFENFVHNHNYTEDEKIAIMEKENHYKQRKEEIKKYLSSISFAIVDESHHSASETYQEVFKELKNTRYRLGTTATAKRDDGTEMIMFSLLGDVVYKISSEELIKLGYLVKPKIYFIPLPETEGNSDDLKYHEDYDLNIANNENRDNIIKQIAELALENNKKVLIITKLVEKHGKELDKKIEKAKYIHGSLDSETRKQYMSDFKSQKSGILMATINIASEGLDIPDLDIIINASGNKSDVKSIQALGRILRIFADKKTAVYIDFVDVGKYTKEHSYNRMDILKKESHNVEILQQENINIEIFK